MIKYSTVICIAVLTNVLPNVFVCFFLYSLYIFKLLLFYLDE